MPTPVKYGLWKQSLVTLRPLFTYICGMRFISRVAQWLKPAFFPVGRQWLNWLKATVSVAVVAVLGWKLVDAGYDPTAMQPVGWQGWLLLALSALLVVANVGLEVLKWTYATEGRLRPRRHELRGVLAGWAWGFVTPNRVGEYAGRAFAVDADDRAQTLSATYLGRVCQMIVTLLVGNAAALLCWPLLPDPLLWATAIGLVVGNTSFLVMLLLPAPMLRVLERRLGRRFDWTGQLRQAFVSQRRRVWGLLMLSALRYGFFTLQFVMLLYAFNSGVELPLMLGLTALVFLFKSLLPVLAFSEIGVREAVALEVFAVVAAPTAPVFTATFLLYAFNTLVPALVGAFCWTAPAAALADDAPEPLAATEPTADVA